MATPAMPQMLPERKNDPVDQTANGGKITLALSLVLILAGAPILLSSSDGSSSSPAADAPVADKRILQPSQKCPPGMIYGLRPKVEEGPSSRRRRLQELEMGCVESTRIEPEDDTCVNALPYGVMHDARPSEVLSYQEYQVKMAGGPAASRRGYDGKIPDVATLPPGSSFANWNCRQREDMCEDRGVNGVNKIKGSAWTADGKDVEFFGYRPGRWARHEQYWKLNQGRKTTELTGVDVVAHTGFFPPNFGHILHDNLPAVAWLRSIVPDRTIFLLPDTKTFRSLVHFIDPEFPKRVYWYQPNEIITVKDGTLTVSNQRQMYGYMGNTLWKYLRHWIAENHPKRYLEERTIVYYARGIIPGGGGARERARRLGDGAPPPKASANTKHGRLLDPRHEEDVVATIRAAMERHGREEKLVFFTGSNKRGDILPFEVQLDVFRRASTIIGPHGSGLANIAWTDPFPTCEERVKMLEFIPGSDSAQVQQLYNGYYWNMRGMPLEWHQLTYAANSTQDTTYIRLPDLERALDDMWAENI
eukprot:CAMPEP_0113553626 /NCGR_PEP_ID=MMETSP0015_2-20120614/15716_1 /TAXON_ID=2838 /ORGANISM="Odontella" /LENGTH=531 /DNA_ID=CAMNT_0000454713 /DNA_START=15 /DNA_END=1610 /DNA_ORIENTATION=+ /assembly_acc=CAM_ASM_000160